MSNKVYVLQRDLPNAKAGTEFEWKPMRDQYCYYEDYSNDNCHGTKVVWYNKEEVENNPEWFKLKEQSELEKALKLVYDNGYQVVKISVANTVSNTIEPERIVISNLVLIAASNECATDKCVYSFNSSKPLEEISNSEIIKAIESVVNKSKKPE